MEYHPYSSYHVSESLQILLFTALVFFVLVKLKKIEPHAGRNLDLDWFYRMGGRALLWLARKPVQAIDTGIGEVYRVGGLVPLMKSAGMVGRFDNRVIDGAVDGLASAVRGVGARLRFAQRGALQENLTFVFAVAALLLLVFVIFF
jgi:multicomponent Na+:H+ antiporter subunit D